MVASLWSGTWFASQLPLNQIEATASNVRKLRYVIEAVGHSLDVLDAVVGAFNQVDAERPAAMCQDATKVRPQAAGDAFKGSM
jgi:hypothetical protein